MNTNRLVLCVAAAGLLLSGCSSQSDSDASESTSAATSTSVAATVEFDCPQYAFRAADQPARRNNTGSRAERRRIDATGGITTGSATGERTNRCTLTGRDRRERRREGAAGTSPLCVWPGSRPPEWDSAEILYADGTCKALADGMPRSEVLAEFNSVGEVYSQITPDVLAAHCRDLRRHGGADVLLIRPCRPTSRAARM